MQITLGRATGLDLNIKGTHRGFILMIFGWTICYAHFLEDYVGIAWSRSLEIGKRRWWFTESWKTWAKRDKSGFRFVLSKN